MRGVRVLLVFSYFGLGLIQTAAMFAGFREVIGRFLSLFLGLILGQIPVMGTIMGKIGATRGWEWPWWAAALLFIGFPLLLILCWGFAFKSE